MAAQAGKDMLLKVSSDGTNLGTMNTVGGLTSTSMTMNNSTIEVTSISSTGRWRELIIGGVRSLDVSGQFRFYDDDAVEDLRGHLMATNQASLAYLEIVVPDFGTFAGTFHVSSLDFSGAHDAAVECQLSCASAGEITFAAAV